jgi:hypothetical protein
VRESRKLFLLAAIAVTQKRSSRLRNQTTRNMQINLDEAVLLAARRGNWAKTENRRDIHVGYPNDPNERAL